MIGYYLVSGIELTPLVFGTHLQHVLPVNLTVSKTKSDLVIECDHSVIITHLAEF